MSAKELLKDKFNDDTNFFILDSHTTVGYEAEENSHSDIDFEYYSYNTRQHNKLCEGDWFIYRKPSNSTKDKKFFFYGICRVKQIIALDEVGNVRAILESGYRFKNPLYQGGDILENMRWTFKPKGPTWRYFFTQYGMTHINKEDFFNVIEAVELYSVTSTTPSPDISTDDNQKSKDLFSSFLVNDFEKSEKTLKNYQSAINVISRELSSLYNTDINIYNISDPDIISEYTEAYMTVNYLKEKNIRGQRMYTAALNAYNKFLSSSIDIATPTPKKPALSYIPKPKGEFTIEEGKKKWIRNPNIVNSILSDNNYMCEYDPSHIFFTSQKTNNNYVEGHHLIPMSYQDDFINSLDTEANIISLCPVCHRLLHFGVFEDKINILKKLYESRSKYLVLAGIDISFDDLLSLYK